jgi:antitoxin component YwqK of YwqJK toxin-antitoxin module
MNIIKYQINSEHFFEGERNTMAEIKDWILSYGTKIDYDGEVVGGKPHGWGKGYYKSGRMYEGEWKEGKQNGYGRFYYETGELWYEGEWKDGRRHGQGKSYFEDGSVAYNGKWEDGKPVK